MNTRKYISLSILHVVFWTVILMMSSLLMISLSPGTIGISGNPFQIRWSTMFTVIIGAIAFYLVTFMVRKLRSRTKMLIFWIIVLIILVSILYFFLIFLVYKTNSPVTFFASGPKVPLFLAFIPVIFFTIMGITFESFRFSITQKEKEQLLINDKLDIELLMIKKQLSPHFLFNTLNNIDSFIYQDKAKASEAIIILSSILRYQLYESDKEQVLLETDIKILEDYLKLQKMRYGQMEVVNYTKVIESANLLIAPALFIPFVENAFKYAPMNNKDKVIDLTIGIKNNCLHFKIKNEKREGIIKTEHSGMGVKLTKKRLELLYPNKYTLEISETGKTYELELMVELNEL